MRATIDKLIDEKLMELCPQLHLDGFDKVVHSFCKQDMLAYLQYLKKYHIQLTDKVIVYAEIHYFGQVFEYVGHNVWATVGIYGKMYDEEFREWANMWVAGWWRKFQQRVKLEFNKPKKLAVMKRIKKGAGRWSSLPKKEKDYILDRAMKSLFSNSEIVCPFVIANSVIKSLLGKKYWASKKEWTFENTVEFAKVLCQHLKHVAYSHGTLVFIFPTKQAYMSEWRGGGDVNVTA